MGRPEDSTGSALEELLNHPALWRARDYAQLSKQGAERGPEQDSAIVSTGFAELDRCLPGGGWPTGALVEILHGICGIGELSLLLPAIAQMIRGDRWLVCVMPPYRIAAPALHAQGIDPERVLVVRDCTYDESIWACEQAMRSAACGAVLIWSQLLEKTSVAARQRGLRGLRRLQVAAAAGNTLAVLFRDPHTRTNASAAVMRLQLHPHDGGLDVELFKSRGGRPVTVRVQLQRAMPTMAGHP